MDELAIEHFPEYFRAVTSFDPDRGFDLEDGHVPFRWQRRLAERVVEQGWPEVLDLPTASGKTATLEIAVFALAAQANVGPGERTAPRRIFFVVDRRVVVDQAYERSRAIASALSYALDETSVPRSVRTVAERLQVMAGKGVSPLGHERLRGGVPRRNAWTRSPSQPAIIACTVDQIGSRLLFRNYDGSPRTASIDAGLVGNDALILLDEAHCARPFHETMEGVRRYREWGERTPHSPFHFVTLSATPDVVGMKDTSIDAFRLTPEERQADEVLAKRLDASKPAALTVARKARVPRGGGWREIADAREKLARNLASHAVSFLRTGEKRRIAVMVNRVATARQVRDRIRTALQESMGSSEDRSSSDPSAGSDSNADELPCDLVLMTGRMRPLDRDALVDEWGPRLAAGTDPGDQARPVIVVSTQSLEVGADFDFDALVTEAASLDALRQRFGRLDRFGQVGSPSGVVVVARYQEKNSEDDPIYGPSLAATWQWLRDEAAMADPDLERWPDLNDGEVEAVVDFGIEALDRQLDEADAQDLQAPVTHAPVLLPAHVDRWVQTSPVPSPDPDPAVFLHGGRDVSPQVNLLWRRDLDGTADEEDLIAALSLCPPSTVESLPVSLGWARRWLHGEDAVPQEESDVEGTGGSERSPYGEAKGRRVVLWRGRLASEVSSDPDEIRPGDYVVVPGRFLGAFGSLLRWSSEHELVADLGDRAQLEARGRPVLRLTAETIRHWSDVVPRGDLRRDLVEYVEGSAEEIDSDGLRAHLERVRERLTSPAELTPTDRWLPAVLSVLLSSPFEINVHPAARVGGIILRGTEIPRFYEDGDEILDEDEADRRSGAPSSVPLRSHLEGVEDTVQALCDRCAIRPSVRADLALAGRLHDVGKADVRFQAVLRGDGLRRRLEEHEVLAKSPRFPTSGRAYRRLANRAGLPDGFRHELVSTRLAESDSDLLERANDPDLVLHLVASHHGRCRPFAPGIADQMPVEVRWEMDGHTLEATSDTGGMERLGNGVAERFWTLVRRYGWWGLAYLEALLRKADHHRSAVEMSEDAEVPSIPATPGGS